VDQLERGQLLQEVAGALADLAEAIDQPPRELPADDRGELQGALGRLGQAVDARRDHVVNRARDGQLADRGGELERPSAGAARRFLQRLGELLDVERVALGPADDERAQLLGQRAAARTARAMLALSTADSAAGTTRVT
jgi:hypothetical protein